MIELRLEPEAFSYLNNGKILQAGSGEGDFTKEPVGDIVSVIYRKDNNIEVCTHIMTDFDGRVTPERRKKVLHPIYIGQIPVLLSGGTFSVDGIDYSLGIRETNISTGDLHEHKSDVLCTAVKGRFTAANQTELESRLSEYCAVISQVYLHLYDPRNTEKLVGKDKKLSPSQVEIANSPTNVKIEASKRTLTFDQYADETGPRSRFLQDLKSCHYEGELCVMQQLQEQNMAKAAVGGVEKSIKSAENSPLVKVKWSEVGGFRKQKEQARRFLDDVLDPESMRYSGRDPAEKGGMIFIGPSGFGKSFFARACATEAIERWEGESRYLYTTYGKVASKYRGQEAINARKEAEKIERLISKGIFVVYLFEEVQSVGEREEDWKPANEYLNELLAQMGNFNYSNCLIMAATARSVSDLDPQLIRPGRFGEHVIFKAPLSVGDATDILKKVTKKSERIALEAGNKKLLSADFDYRAIGKELTDFSPSEIGQVVETALTVRTKWYRRSNKWEPLTLDSFEDTIQTYRAVRLREKTNADQL